MAETLGKKAEAKIREWLDKPSEDYCFDRIPDQTSGYFGSSNICDFDCYKYPFMYYIESKETENDRWEFNQLSDIQRKGLYDNIVLFTTYKRAVILDIRDIVESGEKSINIKKIDKWSIPYVEINTVPSRKLMLDYTGKLEDYVAELQKRRNI